MNRTNYIFLIFIGICCISARAQSDSIRWLQEVELSDSKLKSNSSGQHLQSVSDSIVQYSDPALTNVLKFNSPFFFRENGFGMVSSASVRGTGASQTAVVWNGININSQFTGQTDFNTINSKTFDDISLRPGGGSVLYGSGAIGGTIHLNNSLRFNNANSVFVYAGAGSFDTYQASGNFQASNETTALNISLSGIRSANDYAYPVDGFKNENADFDNIALNTSIGHWLAEDHLLKFYSSLYQGNRGFSGTVFIDSNSKYEDRNSRNLLEYKAFFGKFTSSLKFALLSEEFKYYENRNSMDHSFGSAETGIIKYDLKYGIFDDAYLNLIADYIKIDAEGSGIENQQRESSGVALLYNQSLKDFQYDLSLRIEETSDFKSPLLFSVGSKYQLTNNYLLRFNISKNYRIPTFNDLFWLQGGNQDLQPENSLQSEIGVDFRNKKLEINATVFYIDLENLIRWIPDENGVWQPVNTKSAYNYGLELFASWKQDFDHSTLKIDGTYAFTRSIDRSNGNQMIYTPFHKATTQASYTISNWNLFTRSLYNGKIFTSADNNYELDSYAIADFGISHQLSAKPELRIGAEVNNLFNKDYQSLPGRYMPGRSFKTFLTIKF
ncbi:TonB-dependent receptor [Christiangramia portivictoriae]|uniref:TonB-dependent receptor n=1 Tax=Christiangramia portivictoriae TaxID=326069 RepID=UPI00041E7FE3|nr:TonB-dependent receptor [Christiangramia portivictoriae]